MTKSVVRWATVEAGKVKMELEVKSASTEVIYPLWVCVDGATNQAFRCQPTARNEC